MPSEYNATEFRGPSERNILFALGRHPGMAPVAPADLALAGPVGNGLENRTDDVRGVQKGLMRLGLLAGDRTAEPDGIITAATEDAIRRSIRTGSVI